MSIEAMKQALEALECFQSDAYETSEKRGLWLDTEVAALRQAIEQAEKQEPAAWLHQSGEVSINKQELLGRGFLYLTPLYKVPPRREWIGLSEGETQWQLPNVRRFAEHIEAKLRDRNT